MWVIVKNLFTGRLRLTTSDKLFALDTSEHKYWDFNPKNSEDFLPKHHYAEVAGDNICLFYIVYMSG
jgi:hypothetical protein